MVGCCCAEGSGVAGDGSGKLIRACSLLRDVAYLVHHKNAVDTTITATTKAIANAGRGNHVHCRNHCLRRVEGTRAELTAGCSLNASRSLNSSAHLEHS